MPPPAMLPGTNGLAIVALVVSLCLGLGLGSILGLAFGIAALHQIKRRPQNGHGLAMAAVVISAITGLAGVIVAISVITDEVRDRAAGVTGTQADRLMPGDCIRDYDDTTGVSDLPVVPCSQPHEAEVYHVFTLPDGDYPGRAEVEEVSGEKCGAVFEPYDTVENEDIEISFLYPRDIDWSRDQGVTCIAVDTGGTRTTSIKG